MFDRKVQGSLDMFLSMFLDGYLRRIRSKADLENLKALFRRFLLYLIESSMVVEI